MPVSLRALLSWQLAAAQPPIVRASPVTGNVPRVRCLRMTAWSASTLQVSRAGAMVTQGAMSGSCRRPYCRRRTFRRGPATRRLLPRALPLVVLAIAGISAVVSQRAESAFPGKRGAMAYTVRDDYSSRLFLVERDGSNPRRLSVDGYSPAWSPDGKFLAWDSSKLVVARADGSGRRVLGTGGGVAWSPGGSMIALTDRVQGRRGVYVRNVETGEQLLLARTRGSEGGAAWSPDGRWILFGGNNHLFRVRPNGRGLERLPIDDVRGGGVDWSPDARRFVFTRDRELWTANAAGKRVRRATREPLQPRYSAHNAHYSPTGRHILFSRFLSLGPGSRVDELVQVRVDGTGQRTLRLDGPIGPFDGIAAVTQPVCTIYGTNRSDTIVGTPGRDVICGLEGDDTIHGRGGDDVIIGGRGDDTITGGSGRDWLFGSAGDDTLDARDGVRDIVDRGPGADTVIRDEANRDIVNPRPFN